VAQVACESEITECEPLPDGRFYIEVVGRRRFRPAQTAEQDGYRVATPEFLTDAPVGAGSPEAAALAALAGEVETMAGTWVDRLRSLGQSRQAAAELLRRVGDRPASDDAEKLSFWVVSVLAKGAASSNQACHFMGFSVSPASAPCTSSRLRTLRAGQPDLPRRRRALDEDAAPAHHLHPGAHAAAAPGAGAAAGRADERVRSDVEPLFHGCFFAACLSLKGFCVAPATSPPDYIPFFSF
jgi:hypothetical protein